MASKNANATQTYSNSVKSYAEYLASHPETLEKIVDLLNQKGREYFSKETGHTGVYSDFDVEDLEMKRVGGKKVFEVLNKADFLKTLRESDEDAEIWHDEAAFSDSFRHTIFIDIRDPANPTLVNPPPELMSSKTDWILKWKAVETIPFYYPDGNVIALHIDTDGLQIFFPIPTGPNGLPDPKKHRETLKDLKFYALCPNGKRIEVERICEEYKTNPEGLALRSFEDRLVLVMQAVFNNRGGALGGGEEIYWQQAFYLSTGESSGMPGTWLPFDGIVFKHSDMDTTSKKQFEKGMQSFPSGFGAGMGFGSGMGLGLEMPSFQAMKPATMSGPVKLSALLGPPKTQKGGVEHHYGRGYFQKELFADLREIRGNDGAFLDSFGEVFGNETYFPEGDYVYNTDYHFSRLGMLSFALASHAIGGNFFSKKAGDFLFAPTFRKTQMDETENYYKDLLNTSSPLQSCFIEMQTKYPITKIFDVNTYIEENQGFSYMNAFRKEGVFPPGVSAFSVTIKELEAGKNKIPLYEDELKYSEAIHSLWKKYIVGEKTIEQVKEELPRLIPRPKADIDYSLSTTQKENKKKRAYYGGKSRRRKEKQNNKTRKSTAAS